MNHQVETGAGASQGMNTAGGRSSNDAATSSSSGNGRDGHGENGTATTSITTGPSKVDVSHFPHYGLKRGMACTFCRRRKLRCSGDRPSCTNCQKYTKVCEYGPPVKEQKKQASGGSNNASRAQYDAGIAAQAQPQQESLPSTVEYNGISNMYAGTMPVSYDMFQDSNMVDSSFLAASQLSPDGISYQGSTFEFTQPSPFVDTSVNVQPIIGMPPYVPQTGSGFSTFPDQQQSTQWMPAPQSMPGSQAYDPNTMSSASYMDMYAEPSSYSAPYTDASMPSASVNGLPSDPSTPDDVLKQQSGSAISGGSNPDTPTSSTTTTSRPFPSRMYQQTAALHYVADANVVDGLTERLGEFLFSPNASSVKEEEQLKRRKKVSTTRAATVPMRPTSPGSIRRMRMEFDGLKDAARSLLLDCFLAHTTLFFEMSVPRFQYRMTFSDRRRPSLALLNAMYLWATRISNSPSMSEQEQNFFEQGCKHLDTSTSTVDRLIDAVRAAMLLAAYSHSSGRHHEGWCLAGLAVRLVLSCGLHRIKSCVHKPEQPNNPFLRNRIFLLPPPEDAVELGERIHAFWSVFAIDRCGALATGYPSGISDEDITTPFGRPLADIASGSVSERDDVTVRDLYTGNGGGAGENDNNYTKWIKCVAILERSAKLSFRDAAPGSPYSVAWDNYTLNLHRNPSLQPPPEILNQPRYRNPKDYQECRLAVEQLVTALGEEGIFPVLRKQRAQEDGAPEPEITNHTLMLHHLICAVRMMLHDINSIGVENQDALEAARQSVLLFRAMPPIPFTDVDAFVVLVWSVIAKVLVKEIHRLSKLGDHATAVNVGREADVIIEEMARIGMTMHLAGTQAKAVAELKRAAFAAGDENAADMAMPPHLETFLFPLPMPAMPAASFADMASQMSMAQNVHNNALTMT